VHTPSSRMKDLCQKWKVKPIFQGACRLSGTGIVQQKSLCLEIIDEGCNLKVSRLDLTDPDPHILRQIYATAAKQQQQRESVSCISPASKQVQNEKVLRETQTLRAGCSKAEPKIFAPPSPAD